MIQTSTNLATIIPITNSKDIFPRRNPIMSAQQRIHNQRQEAVSDNSVIIQDAEKSLSTIKPRKLHPKFRPVGFNLSYYHHQDLSS